MKRLILFENQWWALPLILSTVPQKYLLLHLRSRTREIGISLIGGLEQDYSAIEQEVGAK